MEGIAKIEVRRITNLMKNRFGRQVGTTFDAKLACQGQIGAKMGKLTLLGGLRGAKLEPKGALEAAKEAPKGPKRALRAE